SRRSLRAAEPRAERRPAEAAGLGFRAPGAGRDGPPGHHPRPGTGGGPLGLREGVEGDALSLPQSGSRDGLARALAARRRSTDEVWALGPAASPGTSLGPGGPLPPAPADSGSSRDANLHPEAAPADGADAARRRHAR